MKFTFRNFLISSLLVGGLFVSAIAIEIGGVTYTYFPSLAADTGVITSLTVGTLTTSTTNMSATNLIGTATSAGALTATTGAFSGAVTANSTVKVKGSVALDGNVTTTGTLSTAGLTITGAVTRTAQVYTFTDMKIAGASGTDWVLTDGAQKATLAASQTSETLIVKITGLKVGDIITKLNVTGQVESAGGAVVLDADLRKVTAAAADLTDESVATIVRPTVAADVKLGSAATTGVSAAFSETVSADETFYVKVLATTAASTDIALTGIQLTITEK